MRILFIISQFLLLFCFVETTSCSSGHKSDLLSLKFDEPVIELTNTQKMEEFQDPNYGIYCKWYNF